MEPDPEHDGQAPSESVLPVPEGADAYGQLAARLGAAVASSSL